MNSKERFIYYMEDTNVKIPDHAKEFRIITHYTGPIIYPSDFFQLLERNFMASVFLL